MPMITQKADLTWSGPLRDGSGKLNVASGAFPEQAVTFKVRAEGGKGTTPEELLAAAHAICYGMSLAHRLAENGAPADALKVHAECSLDRVDGALKITTMVLNVSGKPDGIDDAKFEELAKDAEANCPVSKALRGNVDIQLKLA